MRSTARRLAREEAGTAMTDARGLYGWALVALAVAFWLWGHHLPALYAYLDHLLPGPNDYAMP